MYIAPASWPDDISGNSSDRSSFVRCARVTQNVSRTVYRCSDLRPSIRLFPRLASPSSGGIEMHLPNKAPYDGLRSVQSNSRLVAVARGESDIYTISLLV